MNQQSIRLDAEQQIFQHSLPLNAHSLDLTKIHPSEANFAYDWLEQLLKKGTLQINAEPGYPASETLQHLFFSNRNHKRNKGLPTLGFGYPILIFRQGTEVITAPLFIWELDLALATGTTNTWIFSHGATEHVRYNAALVERLETEGMEDAEKQLSSVIHNNKVLPKDLLKSCQKIVALLGLNNDSQLTAITACPDPHDVHVLAERGELQWSGIVGAFPPQISATPLPESFEFITDIETADHPFGFLPMDPHQATAMQTIFKQKTTIVEGTAGTGKTHVLTNLLTNALSNGKRCLVISAHLGALRQIQDRLAQANLLQHSLLLQNNLADKPMLLDLLRATANTDTPAPAFDATNYRATLEKCNRLHKKLNENYHSVRSNIFGPYNWTQTVGRFLRSNRVEGKELLTSQLHPQDFDFNYEEFLALQDQIRTAHPLYTKVNTLKHPLSNLHPTVFTKKDKETSEEFLQTQLRTFGDKANHLHHRYISKINFYTDRLREHYEGIYHELALRLNRLEDKMADYSNRYGADFDHAGAGALKLRGVFSSKVKSVLEARDHVSTSYMELVALFQKSKYFDFLFAPSGEGKNIQKVSQNLREFERALNRWRETLPTLMQEEVNRLSTKQVNENLKFDEDVQDLEYALDLLASELNEAQLYEQSFENKMLTLPKRQKYLEEIIEQLEATRLYMRDFDHFYDWQRNWLLLPNHANKLVRALIKVKPNDWLQAFESWYLNNCLTIASQETLPTEEEFADDFVQAYQQLRSLLNAQINHLWHGRREEVSKRLRRNNRDLYNLLFGKKNQEAAQQKSMQDLLRRGLDSVTQVYPVLLATPYTLAMDLPMIENHFDYVLFDESAYLPKAQMTKAMQLGKQNIIFGDCSQLPTNDESTLLGWARAQNVPNVILETCHRWNPGNLLQFVQPDSMHEEAIGQFSVYFEQLDGRFDERARTNDEEAQRIIHLLNDIKPTEKRTFPTVGIVCFTIEQRDLISAYLLKIKQKWSPGVEKIQQLERNGLGVFHIDELKGLHFDVVIVSTTYGIMDSKGNLTEQAKLLNTPDFNCSIRLLMSRPLQEVFIVNSIPAAELARWQEMPEEPGIFLLANYFAYNIALQHAQADRQHTIAQRLKDWIQSSDKQEDTVFIEEISIALQAYLGKERIRTSVSEAALYLPIVISGVRENQPRLAIQPDGFFANTSFTDFVWEDAQRSILKKHGFMYHPLWSINWWKNTRQESRKLASSIIQMDAETS